MELFKSHVSSSFGFELPQVDVSTSNCQRVSRLTFVLQIFIFLLAEEFRWQRSQTSVSDKWFINRVISKIFFAIFKDSEKLAQTLRSWDCGLTSFFELIFFHTASVLSDHSDCPGRCRQHPFYNWEQPGSLLLGMFPNFYLVVFHKKKKFLVASLILCILC